MKLFYHICTPPQDIYLPSKLYFYWSCGWNHYCSAKKFIFCYTSNKIQPVFISFICNGELYFYILAFACRQWHNGITGRPASPRKRGAFITNTHVNETILRSTELQQLIQAAQKNSDAAIARLCQAFAPLIRKETHREAVYRILGEDAANIAWEIFLRFIRRYKGADFEHLPGLIRCHLHYELLHEISRHTRRQQKEIYDDGSISEQLIQANDELQRLTLRLLLQKALSQLPPMQQDIIKACCLKRQPARFLSQRYSCTCANILKHRRHALLRLRHLIS